MPEKSQRLGPVCWVKTRGQTDADVADALDAIGGDLESSSRSALDAYLRIAPTISIAQGDRLAIFVNRDLTF